MFSTTEAVWTRAHVTGFKVWPTYLQWIPPPPRHQRTLQRNTWAGSFKARLLSQEPEPCTSSYRSHASHAAALLVKISGLSVHDCCHLLVQTRSGRARAFSCFILRFYIKSERAKQTDVWLTTNGHCQWAHGFMMFYMILKQEYNITSSALSPGNI